MILDAISAAYAEGNTAKVMALMPELMDARDKTVFEAPCKVGDTVFALCDNGQILSTMVMGFQSQNNLWVMFTINYNEHGFSNTHWFRIEQFGVTVFLTEAAAHEALEVQNGTDK